MGNLMRKAILLVVFTLVSIQINAKFVQEIVQPSALREANSFIYLTKFYLKEGGTFDFKVKLRFGDKKDSSERGFKVHFYDYDTFPETKRSISCEEKESLAFMSENMILFSDGRGFEYLIQFNFIGTRSRLRPIRLERLYMQ